MEEISFKGEIYTKASVIAEKFGYTSDYIGQLCRSGNVEATLVGRSWYVNEKSLKAHKKTRYRSNLAKSKESIRKHTENRPLTASPRFMQRVARYESDDSALIPVTFKQTTEHQSHEIDLAEEEKQENKPRFKVNSGLSEKFDKENLPLKLQTKPSVRIISAKSNSSLGEIKPVKGSISLEVKQNISRNSLIGHFFYILLLLTLLILSFGIAAGFTGLEKRIVTLDDGSGVTLYNFDLSKVKEFIFLYF